MQNARNRILLVILDITFIAPPALVPNALDSNSTASTTPANHVRRAIIATTKTKPDMLDSPILLTQYTSNAIEFRGSNFHSII